MQITTNILEYDFPKHRLFPGTYFLNLQKKTFTLFYIFYAELVETAECANYCVYSRKFFPKLYSCFFIKENLVTYFLSPKKQLSNLHAYFFE